MDAKELDDGTASCDHVELGLSLPLESVGEPQNVSVIPSLRVSGRSLMIHTRLILNPQRAQFIGGFPDPRKMEASLFFCLVLLVKHGCKRCKGTQRGDSIL